MSICCVRSPGAGGRDKIYYGVDHAQFLAEFTKRKVASSPSVTEIQRRQGAVRQTGVVVAEDHASSRDMVLSKRFSQPAHCDFMSGELKPEVISFKKKMTIAPRARGSRDPKTPSQHHHTCLTGLARRTGISVGRHMRLQLSSAHQPISPSRDFSRQGLSGRKVL